MDGYDIDWDEANEEKLLLRHFVRVEEIEQMYYQGAQVRRIRDGYIAIGRTDNGRWLHAVFEVRDGRIRAYSARDLTPKEKRRFMR